MLRRVASRRLQLNSGDGGFAIGVVDAAEFDVRSQNIGATPNTWCLSRTGKVSDGTGFVHYTGRLEVGDTVGVHVDLKRHTIRFFVNGEDRGIAFSNKPLKGRTLVPAVCAGSKCVVVVFSFCCVW